MLFLETRKKAAFRTVHDVSRHSILYNFTQILIILFALYHMISFVIPSLCEVVTSVNIHTYISTATSRQSTDVFCDEYFASRV